MKRSSIISVICLGVCDQKGNLVQDIDQKGWCLSVMLFFERVGWSCLSRFQLNAARPNIFRYFCFYFYFVFSFSESNDSK